MLSEITDEKTAKRQRTYELFDDADQHLKAAEEALKKCQEIDQQLKELEKWTIEADKQLAWIDFEARFQKLSKPDTF